MRRNIMSHKTKRYHESRTSLLLEVMPKSTTSLYVFAVTNNTIRKKTHDPSHEYRALLRERPTNIGLFFKRPIHLQDTWHKSRMRRHMMSHEQVTCAGVMPKSTASLYLYSVTNNTIHNKTQNTSHEWEDIWWVTNKWPAQEWCQSRRLRLVCIWSEWACHQWRLRSLVRSNHRDTPLLQPVYMLQCVAVYCSALQCVAVCVAVSMSATTSSKSGS